MAAAKARAAAAQKIAAAREAAAAKALQRAAHTQAARLHNAGEFNGIFYVCKRFGYRTRGCDLHKLKGGRGGKGESAAKFQQ